MRSFSISLGDSSGVQSPEHAHWASEDIFEVRDATDEDEENMYFFPKRPSGPRLDGYNPRSPQVGESMHSNLKLLGLPTGVLPSLEIVRGAYRKRALTVHPDKGGTKEQFQVLQNAYEAVIEVLIRSGAGAQGEVTTHTEPHEGGQAEATPDDFDTDGGACESPELSEADKHLRRHNALEAALRRQGRMS